MDNIDMALPSPQSKQKKPSNPVNLLHQPELGVSFPQQHETYPGTRENQHGGTAMLSLLWTALIGLVVGAIAKFIMPGKDPGGIFVTMLIGIAGSFLGTWLGRMIGHYEPGQSAGFLMSLVGALILLGIYHLIRRSRPTT
jgi:uncharacterized membrane protein YeaQ/YmgE (transglycosylase-associated protein family)